MPSMLLNAIKAQPYFLFCRAPQAGAAHLVVAWRYEPLVRLDALAYRTARYAQAVQALPLLYLSCRLVAGVAGSAPGGCLLQAQLHNLSFESVLVTGLSCHSSSWQLCNADSLDGSRSGSGDGGGSLPIAPDASAAMHRLLVPGEDASAGVDGAATGAIMTAAEAGLLQVSRHVAAAAPVTPKHLQPPAQQQQRQHPSPQQRPKQHTQDGAEGMDVVVLWQADGKDGAAPRRGFCCLHNQRCV